MERPNYPLVWAQPVKPERSYSSLRGDPSGNVLFFDIQSTLNPLVSVATLVGLVTDNQSLEVSVKGHSVVLALTQYPGTSGDSLSQSFLLQGCPVLECA